MSSAREFLVQKLREDFELVGEPTEQSVNNIANAWMDDKVNSKHRYIVIQQEMPEAKKILDMASGAGSFVYYGLLNGYDTYGIDPEEWKLKFNQMKSDEYEYPKEWIERFCIGYGESLPYDDSSFDMVSTYQTLEHVQDVKMCLEQMCRVVKDGGGIHIMCPDYRSTYEAHYGVAFLPLFPRRLAKMYLKLRGKNPIYLDTLTYTTKTNIKEYLKQISKEKNIELEITDIYEKRYKNMHKDTKIKKHLYPLFYLYLYFKNLFKSEMHVNYFVRVKK